MLKKGKHEIRTLLGRKSGCRRMKSGERAKFGGRILGRCVEPSPVVSQLFPQDVTRPLPSTRCSVRIGDQKDQDDQKDDRDDPPDRLCLEQHQKDLRREVFERWLSGGGCLLWFLLPSCPGLLRQTLPLCKPSLVEQAIPCCKSSDWCTQHPLTRHQQGFVQLLVATTHPPSRLLPVGGLLMHPLEGLLVHHLEGLFMHHQGGILMHSLFRILSS